MKQSDIEINERYYVNTASGHDVTDPINLPWQLRANEVTVTVLEKGIEDQWTGRKSLIKVRIDDQHDLKRYDDEKSRVQDIPARLIIEGVTDREARIEAHEAKLREAREEQAARLKAEGEKVDDIDLGSLLIESRSNAGRATNRLRNELNDLIDAAQRTIARLDEGTDEVSYSDKEEREAGFYPGHRAPVRATYPVISTHGSGVENATRRVESAVESYVAATAVYNALHGNQG